jgi:hypothetical protein
VNPDPIGVPDVLASTAAGPAPPIEWTYNPWRGDPRRVALAVLFMVVVGGVLLQAGIATLTGVALMLAFLFTISPAFWVLRCRVDESGVARRLLFVWERRPWERIRRADVSEGGLIISPQARPGVLDAFRALWLPLPALAPEERLRMMAELRRRVRAHGL